MAYIDIFCTLWKFEVNDDFGFRVGWERLVANLGILCGESVGIGSGLWEFIALGSGEYGYSFVANSVWLVVAIGFGRGRSH